MADDKEERCENCKYWLTPQEVAERRSMIARHHMHRPGMFGQCKRHLPGHGPDGSYEYPYSPPDHWCDEWAQRG